MKLFIPLFFLILSNIQNIIGQSELPKLYQQLNNASSDTSKVRLLLNVCAHHQSADSLLFYTGKAIALVDSTQAPQSLIEILNYQSVGWFKKQDCARSRACSQRAYDLSIQEESFVNAGLFANRIGICFRVNNQPSQAIAWLRKSTHWYNVAQDSFGLSAPYIGIANVHRQIGRVDSAIYYYKKAYDLAKASPTHQGNTATAITNLGSLYLTYQKDYEQALDYQRQGLQLARKLGLLKETITALNTIGATHLKAERPDSAYLYFSDAIEFNKNIHKYSLLYSYLNCGIIHRNKGQYGLAKRYYRKIITCCSDHPDFFLTYSNMSMLHQTLGQLDSAQWYLEKAEKMVRSVSNTQDKIDLYFQLSELYQKIQEPQKAFTALQKAYNFQDTFFNEKRIEALEIAKARYRYDSVAILNSELIKADLQLNNQQLKMQSERQRSMLLTILALVFLTIGVVIAWYFWRERRRNIALDHEIKTLLQEDESKINTNTISPIDVYVFNKNEKTTLPATDILYLQAQAGGTIIITQNGEKYWYPKSLKKLITADEVFYNSIQFVQIHKSYLVNLEMISGYSTRSNTSKRFEIILDNSKIQKKNTDIKLRIPIGDVYKANFKSSYKAYKSNR